MCEEWVCEDFVKGRTLFYMRFFSMLFVEERMGSRTRIWRKDLRDQVLFDTVNGHSFEVDTWSIGVILYVVL